MPPGLPPHPPHAPSFLNVMSSEFDWILQKAMGMGSIILLLLLLLAFGCLCHSVISLCCVWLKTYCNWAEEKKKSPSPE